MATTTASKMTKLLRNRVSLFQELTDVYGQSMVRNKEKIMEMLKERAVQASKSDLARKMRIAKGFYTVEMAPPAPNEIDRMKADLELAKQFVTSGCYKFLTVKQAWLLFLVCVEVGLWFYLGETIGKMHIVGYKV